MMSRFMDGNESKAWYDRLWGNVTGPRVLEVGVGTGRSFPHHPRGLEITAVDLSDRMLAKARAQAGRLGVSVDLRQMDVQELAFPDNTFDTVVAACTFCSVPDPVLGFREIRRVTKSGGRVVLLEHMRHDNRFIGKLMDLMNPITAWLIGPNINRRTLDNLRKAGMEIEAVENLAWGGILKLIVARPAKNSHTLKGGDNSGNAHQG
ncbi:MAG: class I SAM-dependent methyltransferase [Chloroflexi bacterium]|nr:class I SAM-dependent methyltransferase [Chloroflexota bacterium]